jgi:phasin
MNEITTSATKAKTAKHMRDSFGLSKNAIPQLEVPADFREMIDKGVAQARDAYAKAKAAGEEAAATAAKGATGYNLKLIEIARANAGAAFDYAHELLGVKSPSEFIALSTAQMRKQFDIASAQNKELFALAQQVATEAAEPIKTGVSKALNRAI